ncbi:MAG: peptide chain release factor 1 [Deltaproteobacteria bacterium]|nr:peptide chain release factor 1 [Deltaproteobacteria bacterium]
MLEKLQEVENRFLKVEESLGDGETFRNQAAYQKLAKEHADLSPLIAKYRRFKALTEELHQNEELLEDPDTQIRDLARSEIQELKEQLAQVDEEIKLLLLPQDPNDEKNILLEIRAGTGGEEAALFAADLFRMYSKFAEIMNWRVEIMSDHPTGMGGFKEIIALIEGKGAYSQLKYESGVHRVQRVPSTESQGRLHTSAVTVAVLPEAEEVDVTIDPEELRVDVFRSSGPGGQSVNTTDSAVRVTHLPSGLVVSCQDEKSQHKNKAKALKILRARLLDLKVKEQQDERAVNRKSQVGSGDRSERIRTYNFPQNRLTDHRIGLTLYQLDQVMEGRLNEVIDALNTHYQSEQLKAHGSS